MRDGQYKRQTGSSASTNARRMQPQLKRGTIARSPQRIDPVERQENPRSVDPLNVLHMSHCPCLSRKLRMVRFVVAFYESTLSPLLLFPIYSPKAVFGFSCALLMTSSPSPQTERRIKLPSSRPSPNVGCIEPHYRFGVLCNSFMHDSVESPALRMTCSGPDGKQHEH